MQADPPPSTTPATLQSFRRPRLMCTLAVVTTLVKHIRRDGQGGPEKLRRRSASNRYILRVQSALNKHWTLAERHDCLGSPLHKRVLATVWAGIGDPYTPPHISLLASFTAHVPIKDSSVVAAWRNLSISFPSPLSYPDHPNPRILSLRQGFTAWGILLQVPATDPHPICDSIATLEPARISVVDSH